LADPARRQGRGRGGAAAGRRRRDGAGPHGLRRRPADARRGVARPERGSAGLVRCAAGGGLVAGEPWSGGRRAGRRRGRPAAGPKRRGRNRTRLARGSAVSRTWWRSAASGARSA
jgi:hypothetical protein